MNTYEQAAVALARANGAITASDLAKKLSIGLVFARVVLKGLERRQIIKRVDRLGRHKLIGPKTDDVASANDSQTADARIANLEAKIERLRWAGRIALSQRDEWEAKARAAETRLQEASRELPSEGQKLAYFKRIVARELHPDSAQGDLEKDIREALFKKIWGLVEQL